MPASLMRRVDDEHSVTRTQHNQHKTDAEKHILGVSEFFFRMVTIQSGKRISDCFSAEEKKRNQLLACIEKSN